MWLRYKYMSSNRIFFIINSDRRIVGQTPIKEQAVKAAMNYSRDDKQHKCYGVSEEDGPIAWFSENGFVCTL